MYHRVIPQEQVDRDAVEPGMYVTPETFSRHVDWLAEEFRVVALQEIVERLAKGQSLPPRACAITFDDGWRDNLEYAAPALERLREMGDTPPACSRELLDWAELERLAGSGFDIESHGATHAILTGLPEPSIERELQTARSQLLDRGHGKYGLLAYPSGGFDSRVQAVASRCGYSSAVTTQSGLLDSTVDPFTLPRLGIHDDISRTRAEFLYRIPGAA